MSGDPHFKGATPEALARSLLRPLRKSKPTTPEEIPPKSWRLSVEKVFEQDRVRFDASFFDPKIDSHIETLSGIQTTHLSELAKVILPSRLERVWAVDEDRGKPYLNATDLLCLFSLGVPQKVRYLSPESDTDVDVLIIREGWLLLTCSGTIGRIYHVPKRLDGWAATHDLIRIIPKSPDLIGYLFAWCMTPVAQAQILGHTHGGQIDHVTDEQVGSILVPIPKGRSAKKIHESVIKSLADREKALDTLVSAWPRK